MLVTILVRPSDGRMIVLMLTGARMEVYFHNRGNWYGKSRLYEDVMEATERSVSIIKDKTDRGFIIAHSWSS